LSNIKNVDGRPTQLTAADPGYVDYYGRPWAKDWEKYFEVGWDKPQTELPQDILDLFTNVRKPHIRPSIESGNRR
jgi:hypothetical protein